ncbi:non-ribosomal peptide synthetase [Rhodococcus zopfii]|uniref:non-ribosomal peptide synthetase n=1 Tax=Rhodococcus zopfii TaxID=43772 RepID=UPI00093248DD|nr:non-ribosomal peptide synthetase [Rhodococcus zopfii]
MRDVEDSGRSDLENLPRLIANVVSRDPERVALVRDGAVVTYAGLNAELAALGAAMGDAIGPDALVPVVLTGLLPGLAGTGPDDVAAALAELSDDLAAFEVEEQAPDAVRPDTLPAAFAAQAAATPDAVAVEFDGVEYTYGDLADRSRRLARRLVASGVGPDVTVAVALRRSFDLLVAVYAVLEAGGAYVPLDPDHPAERLTYILEVAEPAVLLTGATAPVPVGEGIEVLDVSALDLESTSAAPLTDTDRHRPLHTADTAYVIFTSGSTGRPKGVAVTHEAIVANLRWRQEQYRLGPADVVLHKTPVTFDVSVWELFWPLQTGARLVVAAPEGHRDPRYLVDLMRVRGITVAHFVPSMLSVFVAEAELDSLTSLRYLFASGEALPARIAVLVRELLPAVAVHNLYGPTEAAVDVTHHEVTDDDTDSVPIGAPIADTDLLILDSGLNWVPAGAQGELYLAGTQLARGYVARPELTAERFVANPYGAPGERMYRTGDLVVRSRADELEYLGRSDFQVKIRGLRIELGEIEETLARQDGIAQAAVRVHGDDALGDRLVAYVRLRPAASWDEGAVVAALSASLPDYMVPTAYCVLDEFPLTTSGKLDRAALPAPEAPAPTGDDRLPETATETVVAAVFAEMLGRDRVGVDDNFFALGGNSLGAVRAVSRISARLGKPLSVQDFFDAPTAGGVARLVDRVTGNDPAGSPLVAGPRPYPVPLAPAQTRLWILDRLDPGSALYNIPLVVRLTGSLDVDALQQAVGDLVERHEVLRTAYPEVDGAGTQLVLPVGAAQRAVPVETVVPDEVPARIDALVSEGFDIAEAAPVRTHLLRVADDEHILVVVVHHIAGDGFSAGPLTRDLMRAYGARTAGVAPERLPLPVQYADYALWQRDRLGDPDEPDSLMAQQLGYWSEELAGLQDRLELPTDRPRPAVASQSGAAVPVEIPADIHGAVAELARTTGTTEFMVVHAALAVLLARLSGTPDVAVGTPSAGRGDAGLDELVGMFVNTLVLRTPIDAAESFTELLTRVRDIDLGAFGHQDVPFDCIVDDLAPARSQAYHPLFQVMLAFQNVDAMQLELPSLTVTTVDVPTRQAKFDLQVTLAERFGDEREPAGIVGEVAYSTDLFDAGTIEVFVRRFVRILAEATAAPDRAVGDHRLLDRAELGTVLGRWNSTDRPVPPATVPRLLDAQAARTPHLQAVIDDDGALTYADFAARVHRLARRLIAAGVGPERTVAVVAPRSVELLIAVHAVLHAGGAYVPVDPDQPVARTERVLAAARPVVVLVGSTVERSDGGLSQVERSDGGLSQVERSDGGLWQVERGDSAVPVLRIDDVPDLSDAPIRDAERLAPLRPDNTAYVLFTSGSTGEPKGVAVPHRAVVNQLLWIADLFRISVADTVLWKTPATFDVSVWEMFAPLASGARMVVAAPEAHRDARQLADIIGRRAVTLTSFVPSLLSVFATTVPDPAALRTLRAVAVAGEALPAATVGAFRAVSRAAVHNLYGPTEFTVHATSALVPPMPYLASRPVPMGRPVWNTRAVVLDSRMHPVPVGVRGELYLSGVQEARGYHGRPDLTAERFVADRFGPAGARLYRTGDCVQWTAEGQLLYLGRTDSQVKIRGVRIELGDIESALLNRSEVAQAVATVHHAAAAAGDRLVAYVVAAPAEAASGVDAGALRSALVRVLPAHLVPDAIVVVDGFPVTSSGKLDRAALPDPVFETREFVSPATDAERIVADVFAAVLGVETVGAQDDFFALGGNSLSATQVAARLADELGADVTVRSLFDTRTVAEFAALLEDSELAGAVGGPVSGPRPERLPLSWSQSRMWFLNRFDTGSGLHNIPLVVRLSGTLDVDALCDAFGDVVARHEVLRTVYPEADGTGHQVVLTVEQARPQLPIADVPAGRLDEELAGLVGAGFDVTAEVPVRARLLRIGDGEYVLAVVVHHIAADGFSVAPLIRDLAAAYTARVAGQAPDWEPLPVQYADYALWQREILGDGTDPDSGHSRKLAYWREHLAGLPAQLDLPSDRRRPATGSGRGGQVHATIPAATRAAIDATAERSGATPFMVVHAALALLLSRLSGSTDIAVGTPLAGRGHRVLDDLVGMFVNTVVLRTEIDPAESFTAFLSRVREVDLAAHANSEIPFERLVEALDPERSPGRHPLFQVALAYQNFERQELTLPDLTVAEFAVETHLSKFDLQFAIGEAADTAGGPGALSLVIGYATDLFDAATVEVLAERLVRILDAVTAVPYTAVGDVEILSPDERAGVLTSGRRVGLRPQTLPALLAAAAADPTAVAVVSGDAALTYGDLDAAARRWARVLRERGVGRGDLVLVAVPRSAESILAMWAVARCGAGFVPVDVDYPADRLAYVVADSGARVGLTLAEHRPALPAGPQWLALDDDAETFSVAADSDSDPAEFPPVYPGEVAYVIYTSGSTGTPKGVTVTHAGLYNLCVEVRERYRLDARSRVLHVASPSFDASVLEQVFAVSVGATVVVAPAHAYGGSALAGLMRDRAVTHAFLTPSVAATVDPDDLGDCRVLVTGGEAVTGDVVRRWAVGGRAVFNAYGPTEATIMTHTAGPLSPGVPVALGHPVRGAGHLVLDSRLRPVPVGVPGELYLVGDALARGYHRRVALTAARFVANPLDGWGERMYRTGDVVSRNVTGELVYHGRSDFQVKIHGLRIELGEIDAVLLADDAVAAAVTVGRDTAPRLVAYVVPAVDGDLDEQELLRVAASRLPAHMVPSAIVVLDALPLTPSGKLDRRALPEPSVVSRPFRAPSTRYEQGVAEIYSRLLDVEQVGADDDFFDLGGHSLLILSLAAAVTERFGVEVTVPQLFEHAPVYKLARLIEAGTPDASPAAEWEGDLELAADIVPDGIPAARPDGRRVLLTGATGFLGRYLLRDLLAHSGMRVWCLVRTTSEAEGLDRIEAGLRAFGLWREYYRGRIVVVPGDLGQPRLGLSDTEFDDLARGVDVIVHNGARVNHIEPYSRMRAANVSGTEEILRLAVTGTVKPVHFVSTGSVLTDTAAPVPADGAPRLVGEDDRLPTERVMDSGYVRSKWVAEELVAAARRRGIPVSIYRPGLISGDTVSGAAGTDDAFWNVVRAMVALRMVPESAVGSVALVPVTYVAAALVALALDPSTIGGNFHLVNRRRVAADDLVARLRAHGFELRPVSDEVFATALIEASQTLSERGDDRLTRAMLVAGEFAQGLSEAEDFDDENARRALVDSALECPVVDDEVLAWYVTYFAHIGFLEPLADGLVPAEQADAEAVVDGSDDR